MNSPRQSPTTRSRFSDLLAKRQLVSRVLLNPMERTMKKIAVLVGSLRRNSSNLALARALGKLGGARFAFAYADIGALPHYNEDLWADVPASVTALKTLLSESDGILLVTPEYNRGPPGVLKNAIDWASRPYGQNSFTGKPVAISGTSPGAVGTAVAQAQLRTSLIVLDAILLGQPEVYFQFKPGLIAEDFSIEDEQARTFLELFLSRFDAWIDLVGTGA
jgi:chromate reductase